ncbi:MAG: Adaptive-response sensory-kinase SasA [Elusimicrobia bacterium]|nr:Adaptive-response sensory-kinase SasA [Elusimicrobiota bacterium]
MGVMNTDITESIESNDLCESKAQCHHIDDRVQFEELISSLASRFITVTNSDLCSVIKESLKLIGSCLNAELCRIGMLSDQGKRARTAYSWRSPKLERRSVHRFDEDPSEKDFPWAVSQMLQGKVAVMKSVDDLPAEAAIDKKSSLRRGEKSWILVPLKNGTRTIGGLAITKLSEPCNWPDFVVRRLQVVGDILGNTLARVEAEESLKKQEEEQVKLRSMIYRATRVSAMGEMTAAISHEINQPLTAILTNAQAAQRFLAMKTPSLDEFRDITRDIVKDIKRAKDVILKLRSLFQQADIELLPLDLNPVITELIPLFQSQTVIHQIELNTELESGLPVVKGDRIQLQQVLLNLILNAIDSMKGSNARELRIISHRKGEDVCVKVSDSGPGISKESMKNLFDPFFTTKKDGMGMGLAISKAIIKAHGGQIGAENNPKRGATFFITLPALSQNVNGVST